jgi:ferrochelatase
MGGRIVHERSAETETTIGILLMAYGGPTSLDQIPAYLADVREGRPPSDELLAEMTHRYTAIGGRSPILELTEAQARGIERELNRAAEPGIRYRAYVGMRHWHPYIREVMPQIVADGVDRLVAAVMAPHYSRMSVGRYMQRVDEALSAVDAQIPVLQVESWKDEPAFIEAIVQRVQQALERFDEAERDDVYILFTAHSLPERILQWNDPYPDELKTSVEAIVDQLHPKHSSFAFQSQGATADPWLGPSVEETLEKLAAEGVRICYSCRSASSAITSRCSTMSTSNTGRRPKRSAFGSNGLNRSTTTRCFAGPSPMPCAAPWCTPPLPALALQRPSRTDGAPWSSTSSSSAAASAGWSPPIACSSPPRITCASPCSKRATGLAAKS